MAFRSGNPALSAKTFQEVTKSSSKEVMTLSGTVNKVGILLFLVIAVAGTVMVTKPSYMPMLSIVGVIGGLITGIITIFNKSKAAVTAPVYAVFEGLFLGSISTFFEARYPGIVSQAITLTFGVFICLLLAYKSRLIKPTENFKLGVVAATGGIALVYIGSMIMGLFGQPLTILTSASPISIAISVFIVIIAALNLVLDFDFIEEGCEQGVPKYMEWYGAFGLLVTLVWLYIEILRLLAKLRDRR